MGGIGAMRSGVNEACKALSPCLMNRERTVGTRSYIKKQFLVMIYINRSNT